MLYVGSGAGYIDPDAEHWWKVLPMELADDNYSLIKSFVISA